MIPKQERLHPGTIVALALRWALTCAGGALVGSGRCATQLSTDLCNRMQPCSTGTQRIIAHLRCDSIRELAAVHTLSDPRAVAVGRWQGARSAADPCECAACGPRLLCLVRPAL